MLRTENHFVELDCRITKYHNFFLSFAIPLLDRLNKNTREVTN